MYCARIHHYGSRSSHTHTTRVSGPYFPSSYLLWAKPWPPRGWWWWGQARASSHLWGHSHTCLPSGKLLLHTRRLWPSGVATGSWPHALTRKVQAWTLEPSDSTWAFTPAPEMMPANQTSRKAVSHVYQIVTLLCPGHGSCVGGWADLGICLRSWQIVRWGSGPAGDLVR